MSQPPNLPDTIITEEDHKLYLDIIAEIFDDKTKYPHLCLSELVDKVIEYEDKEYPIE